MRVKSSTKYNYSLLLTNSRYAFGQFWHQYPAILYALAMIAGAAGALYGIWHWFILILLLSPSALPGNRERLRLLFALFLSVIALWTTSYRFILPEGPLTGSGFFSIDSLQLDGSSFGARWVYKGTLRSFYSERGLEGRNVPVTVALPHGTEIERPLANRDYYLSGLLKTTRNGGYSFKVKKEVPWHPIASSWSLAEWRFLIKTKVTKYIHKRYHEGHSALFLSGISTGTFDDLFLKFSFSRFGLQHIMAISGFHFSLVAAIFTFFLRLLFSPTRTSLSLILILSSYFVFLGCSPSVMRAWISILIAIGGMLLGRTASGINALGIAVILILIFDPLMLKSVGFQFSCLTTASILFFFRSCSRATESFLIPRSLAQAKKLTFFEQHIYFLSFFLRQTLALTLAVNIVALPYTLYIFHKFPLLSLLYNLFFPFMVSISIFLLIVASAIPFFGEALHSLNDHFTSAMLGMTSNLPMSFDTALYAQSIPPWAICSYLVALLYIAIYLKTRNNLQPEWDRVF